MAASGSSVACPHSGCRQVVAGGSPVSITMLATSCTSIVASDGHSCRFDSTAVRKSLSSPGRISNTTPRNSFFPSLSYPFPLPPVLFAGGVDRLLARSRPSTSLRAHPFQRFFRPAPDRLIPIVFHDHHQTFLRLDRTQASERQGCASTDIGMIVLERLHEERHNGHIL